MARFAVGLPLIFFVATSLLVQRSDRQALSYGTQSIAAMTDGNPIGCRVALQRDKCTKRFE